MNTETAIILLGIGFIGFGTATILLQTQMIKATKQINKLDRAREHTAKGLEAQININVNLLSLMTQTDERLMRLELKGAKK